MYAAVQMLFDALTIGHWLRIARRYALIPRLECAGDLEIIGVLARCL